jgi:hypothetical protein
VKAIEAKVFSDAEEKALLKEWFETISWDVVSPGVPVLDPEEDDEGRSIVPLGPVEISNRKADDLSRRTKEPNGGFTVDPHAGKDLKEGYLVAIYPDRSRQVRSLNREEIREYVRENEDLLIQSGHTVSAWHDPDTGYVWLDVSMVTSDKRDAIQLAKEFDRHSVFDLGTGNVINTEGAGNSSYPFVFARANPNHDKAGKFAAKNGTPVSGSDQTQWAIDTDRDLNKSSPFDYGDFNDPVSRPLVGIATQQGFHGQPQKGSVDDAIKAGGTEIHRGIIPHEKSGTTAEDISEKMINGKYEPGTGNYGNGYYFSTSKGIADMYAGAPVAEKGYAAKPVKGGKVVRAALHKDAKIVDYETIKQQHQDWYKAHRDNIHFDTHSTNYIIPPGKISPRMMDGVNDPGHFAALMGWDAIRVPLKDRPSDRRNKARIKKKIGNDDLGDEIVVLNRTALVVDK